MLDLDIHKVSTWHKHGNHWLPAGIDTECPFCARSLTFSLTQLDFDGKRETFSSTSRCPGCGESVFFWVVRPRKAASDPDADQDKTCETIAIHPNSQSRREPIHGYTLIEDTRIQRAYKDTVAAYNHQLWSPAVTSCRRTLEGIIKHLLPDSKRTGALSAQLNELADSVDLAKPIHGLSHAIRQGGNLGAHFDLEREADQETATHVLNFLEYLIEYLFLLPAQISELESKLSREGTSGTPLPESPQPDATD